MPTAIEEQAIAVTRRMVSYMHNRGPDADNLWTSTDVVLGHRRLARLVVQRLSECE